MKVSSCLPLAERKATLQGISRFTGFRVWVQELGAGVKQDSKP